MLTNSSTQIKLTTLVITMVLFACVPAKKFQELQATQKRCAEENEQLKKDNRSLEEKWNELNAKHVELLDSYGQLEEELAAATKEREQLSNTYNQLQESHDLLAANKNAQLSKSASENKKLIEELKKAQLELQSKEDALRTLDKDITLKTNRLKELKKQLDMREARVAELESVLARKDSAVNALKKKVQDALLGFEGNGLTIKQKNGKVYVSLDESLLFESGSFKVDSKGEDVLKKLALVLEQNKDINIVVEGHTDNVPYNGRGEIADNWDLSTMRATAVVKIITGNSKVDPSRLTAAGRSKYLPIEAADSPEARRKNRRTEIILTPKLDELFQILEMN